MKKAFLKKYWSLARCACSAGNLAKMGFVLLVIGSVVWWNTGSSSNRFDFGEVPINLNKSHEFLIPNKESTALYITDAMTSCDCTTVIGAPGMVGPGLAGSFSARLQPKNPGPFRIDIRLVRPEWWKRDLRYQISGHVTSPKPSWTSLDDKHLSPYLISAAVLITREPKELFTLVDIRSQDDYEKAHIPGALWLPLRALITLKNSKDQPIILIDQGNTAKAVVDEIIRLESLGFKKVQILDGGLRAWKMAGGELTGAGLQDLQLGLLEPRDVFVSSDPRWVVVDASGKSSRYLKELFGWAEEKPFKEGSSNYAQKLSGLARDGRKLLVLTGEGENYTLMEQSLAKESGLPIYYVRGGVQGYQEFLKSRLEGREHEKVTLTQKPVNRTVGGTISSSSGCATCP